MSTLPMTSKGRKKRRWNVNRWFIFQTLYAQWMKVRKHLQREQSRTTWNDYNTAGWYLEFLLNVIRKREYYSIVVGDAGKCKSCGKNKKQCIQTTRHACSKPVVEFLCTPLWSCKKWTHPEPSCACLADIQHVNQASSWFWVTVILLRGLAAKNRQRQDSFHRGRGKKTGKREEERREEEGGMFPPAKINHSTKHTFVSEIDRENKHRWII